MNIKYIKDLSPSNYKKYKNEIISMIEEIMRVENINLNQLTEFTRLSKGTLYDYFFKDIDRNITFSTLSKLNNFIKQYLKALEESSDEKYINIDEGDGSIN